MKASERTRWYQAALFSILFYVISLYGIGLLLGQIDVSKSDSQTAAEIVQDIDLLETKAADSPVSEAADDQPASPPAEIQEASPETTAQVMQQPAPEDKGNQNQAATEQFYKNAVPVRILLYFDPGQLRLALAQYNQALAKNAKAASIYSNRGEVYFDLGEFELAMADFNQALLLNPDIPAAYTGRGLLYAKKGQWEQAMTDFNQAEAIDPHNVLACYGKLLCYAKRGDRQNAIKELEKMKQSGNAQYKELLLLAERAVKLQRER